jgi:hypothetical protein
MRAILITALLLTGCATAPKPVPEPQRVEVPIVVKCEPTTNITPVSNAFDKATKEMSLYEKFELALEELTSYRGRDKELTAALRECTK